MDPLIHWLNSTALNKYIMSEPWLWPWLEIFHFLGLCLLFGSLIVVDLRMIGFARAIPLINVYRLTALTLIGFAINLITGILFVIGDPDRYLPNIAFRLKLILIVIAGINFAYFELRVRSKIRHGFEVSNLSKGARYVAAFSLALWTCVIVLGRIIPYVEY